MTGNKMMCKRWHEVELNWRDIERTPTVLPSYTDLPHGHFGLTTRADRRVREWVSYAKWEGPAYDLVIQLLTSLPALVTPVEMRDMLKDMLSGDELDRAVDQYVFIWVPRFVEDIVRLIVYSRRKACGITIDDPERPEHFRRIDQFQKRTWAYSFTREGEEAGDREARIGKEWKEKVMKRWPDLPPIKTSQPRCLPYIENRRIEKLWFFMERHWHVKDSVKEGEKKDIITEPAAKLLLEVLDNIWRIPLDHFWIWVFNPETAEDILSHVAVLADIAFPHSPIEPRSVHGPEVDTEDFRALSMKYADVFKDTPLSEWLRGSK